MTHTIHNVFFAWQHEKEEKWLNEMSAKGLQLVSVGAFKYVFQEGEKGEYLYRLEFMENWPTHPESIAYIRFLEEAGVTHVASFMRWCYFRKKASEGPFELYSDFESKIRHLKRIRLLFAALLPINLFSFISNFHGAQLIKNPTIITLSVLSGLMVGMLGFGMFTVSKKINRLKKEKTIRE